MLPDNNQTFWRNFFIAAGTAITAGMVNICGMMACYSFTANVTGHTVLFAKHLLNANWFDLVIAFTWLFMFFFGSFTASFLIHSFRHRGYYLAHIFPVILEIIIISGVAFYGTANSDESELQTELITAALLFAMGVQNGSVSIVTGGAIKTTHLTGLFTDLGAELSEWLHPKKAKTKTLKNKLQTRSGILFFYITGAVIGGWIYTNTGFTAFYIIAAFLLGILIYDILHLKKNNSRITE